MEDYCMKRYLFILLACSGYCANLHGQSNSLSGVYPEVSPSVYRKYTDQLDLHNLGPSVIRFMDDKFPLPKEWSWNIEHQIDSPGGYHFTLFPKKDGLLLWNDHFKLNCDKKGRVFSVLGTYKPINTHPSNEFIDQDMLIRQTMNAYGGSVREVKPIYYRIEDQIEDQIVPAYDLRLTNTLDHHGWQLIIDAGNGQVLMKHSLMTTKASTEDGKGFVFNPDPLTTGQVFYQKNSPYADNDDQDNAFFQAQYQTVTLKGLKRDSVYRLEGDFVQIKDIDPPRIPPATSTDGNFFFNRSQSGFEDVNCYFHIDTWQRYIQQLGFINLFNRPIVVDAHGSVRDNSAYIWQDKYLTFGTGGVDDGEDADVIIHEYNHALSAEAAPSSNYGRERQALDEGICDYFTASYSRNISEFRWADLYTWDGHNEFWKGRTAKFDQNYTEARNPTNTIHIFGQLWATAMMRVWERIGKQPCDKIALQELYMNATNMTFTDAAHLILDADTLLYQGRHSMEFIKVFCDVGIFDTTYCKRVSRTDGIHLQDVYLYPNPNDGVAYLSGLNNHKYSISDLTGKIISEGKIDASGWIIMPNHINSGMYFLTIYKDGNPIWQLKWFLVKN
jgi:Zn-dependent metalloprotease